MINPLLAPELRELLASNDTAILRKFVAGSHPANVADFLSALEPHEIREILLRLDPRTAARVFVCLEEEVQGKVVDLLARRELARLVTWMSPDERADLVKRLSEAEREALLPALAQAEREDIRRLASYPEGTAGAVMTSDYATLSPELTASQAIEKLRREAPDRETIYYTYVVDRQRRLLGFVSLKDLILAQSGHRVADLMHRDLVFARVDEDQEEAARKIAKYDLIALPVVDEEDRLLGIITYDDAIDVITQENQEDVEKLMAITGAHQEHAYLRTSALVHFRNRCIWVILLALLGLVSGVIVQHFEAVIMQFAILATFMPMLADTGGNTGSQSATLVIRALALGEISVRSAPKVLLKELKVALMLALVLALLAFGRVWLMESGSSLPAGVSVGEVGFAVALALGLQVISATLLGAVLPLLAKLVRLDPAVVASPALTTLVDITGLLIFFTTAKIMLAP